MHVLFLSQWYPHRYDAMLGLFVRKHAQAVVRQGVDVTVLYLHHDEHIRKEELVEQMTDGVREVYVYYPHALGFLKAYRHGYQYIKRKWGRPDLCQLNILSKNGILPLYLWKRYSIPYIIIEHWSGYLPMNRSRAISDGWHKRLMQLICRNAQAVMPVSKSLQQAMQECGFECRRWQVIHNVVDDFFYDSYTPNVHTTKQILHVSCFDEHAKNIKGLLRAILQLANIRQDFQLTLVGKGKDYEEIQQYACTLGINAYVHFTDEQTPQQVCSWMQKSDFLVLLSNFETYGIVLAEATAVGIPSIETNTCGLQLPNECGIIVPVDNESIFVKKLSFLLDHCQDYSREAIRQRGKQFSFEAVGKELKSIYESAISRS